jgi:4'-phosphopantetheinyl transferase
MTSLPLGNQLRRSNVDLRVWHAVLDVDPLLLQQLAAPLSDDEHARAARFYFERDRRRYLVARGILRSILGSLLSVEPSRINFCYGDRGKPALAREFDRHLFFNVAHSQEHVMVAVAEGAEVGIDIETIRPVGDPLAIADRYFSPTERAALHGVTAEARLTAFFQCWTRKEAYIKALGEGLGHPLDSFEVTAGVTGPERLEIRAEGTALAHWSLQDLSALPEYAAAVVVCGHPERVHVESAIAHARPTPTAAAHS